MRVKKIIKVACIIGAVMVFLILVIIGWDKLQDAMFFHPWHDQNAYNELQKIDEFTEIKIENDEVNLSGWFWNIQDVTEPSPLVIFFTGNAQNSSNTLYDFYVSGTMREVFGGYNLMIVDYPGYGLSEGAPSDESMFQAANYIYEYAANMKEVDESNIVIMGYSIGTGVATYLASGHETNGLILIAPYDKALSLYNDTADIFHGPLQGLAKLGFDSATYAESVTEPTLIFTSVDDEVINYRHSLDLAGHFSELDDVVILEGVNHNYYFSQDVVLGRIARFLGVVCHIPDVTYPDS